MAKQLRVLVVDDSPSVRAVLARKLDESPQINVVGRAADGVEALELARKLPPDVVTLDVEMPRMDGLRALEELMRERAERGYVAEGDLSEEDPLGWLVHDDVTSAVAAGYKFAADHPAISTVVTGTSNFDHLEENAAALERPYLSAEDTRRVKELFGDIVEYV